MPAIALNMPAIAPAIHQIPHASCREATLCREAPTLPMPPIPQHPKPPMPILAMPSALLAIPLPCTSSPIPTYPSTPQPLQPCRLQPIRPLRRSRPALEYLQQTVDNSLQLPAFVRIFTQRIQTHFASDRTPRSGRNRNHVSTTYSRYQIWQTFPP
jgi:hypothetical protein